MPGRGPEHIKFNSQFCCSLFPRTQIDTAIHFYQSNSADKKVIWKSQSKKSNLMFQIQPSLLAASSSVDLSLPPNMHICYVRECSQGGGWWWYCGIVLMGRVTCPASYQAEIGE